NIDVCNFGATPGQVFAGVSGSCAITVTIAGLTGTAAGTVRNFSPMPLSFVSIPGFANSVDVNGTYAYVAAGAKGLQVVDVGNLAFVANSALGLQIVDIGPGAPAHIAAAIKTTGTAKGVDVAGRIAVVAIGSAGLQFVDVSNPASPAIVGAIKTDPVNARTLV